MATEFDVVKDPPSGMWQVRREKKVLSAHPRLEEAVAQARAVLLEQDKGTVIVYTPSGRPREKFNLSEEAGHKTVQVA
jgi:Uncharacterized protein conserved in bacteria (DUF2188)